MQTIRRLILSVQLHGRQTVQQNYSVWLQRSSCVQKQLTRREFEDVSHCTGQWQSASLELWPGKQQRWSLLAAFWVSAMVICLLYDFCPGSAQAEEHTTSIETLHGPHLQSLVLIAANMSSRDLSSVHALDRTRARVTRRCLNPALHHSCCSMPCIAHLSHANLLGRCCILGLLLSPFFQLAVLWSEVAHQVIASASSVACSSGGLHSVSSHTPHLWTGALEPSEQRNSEFLHPASCRQWDSCTSHPGLLGEPSTAATCHYCCITS